MSYTEFGVFVMYYSSKNVISKFLTVDTFSPFVCIGPGRGTPWPVNK